MLTPYVRSTGYALVSIGRNSTRYVHRLVGEAFLGECPEGMQVCHGDGEPANNRPENLRYDTSASNIADKRLHGTMARGGGHGRAILSDVQAGEILAHPKRGVHGWGTKIARQYGVAPSTVYMIWNRTNWSHLPDPLGAVA